MAVDSRLPRDAANRMKHSAQLSMLPSSEGARSWWRSQLVNPHRVHRTQLTRSTGDVCWHGRDGRPGLACRGGGGEMGFTPDRTAQAQRVPQRSIQLYMSISGFGDVVRGSGLCNPGFQEVPCRTCLWVRCGLYTQPTQHNTRLSPLSAE